jgi:hypothetical protein
MDIHNASINIIGIETATHDDMIQYIMSYNDSKNISFSPDIVTCVPGAHSNGKRFTVTEEQLKAFPVERLRNLVKYIKLLNEAENIEI